MARPSLKRLACAVLVVLTLSGCDSGPSDPREPVEPSLDYALFIRAEVERLNAAEAGPAVAIDNFVENLEGYESKPLGQYKETIESVAKQAQQLKQLKDQGAGEAELRQKIQELATLAGKLPQETAEQK